MAKNAITKRALIDQANSRVVIATSVAAFVVVFSLVATKTLVSQAAYQNHVISHKKTAVKQLKADIEATSKLKTAYSAFLDTSQNIIGGDPAGSGEKDGDNAKIVLDALPSSYDYPALTASIEKLVSTQKLAFASFTGTDDEVAQSTNLVSGTPQPVPMPFELVVTGDYNSIQGLVNELEHSIRPFQVQSIDISGDQGALKADIAAQTFYQPAKTLNIGKKVVK
jgi:Tfp pilus assembly protein PilO